MIYITKLNGRGAVINADLIEMIEASPDTIVTMTTGRVIIVKEAVDDIIKRVVEYHGKISEDVWRRR
ncbi:MAG: flagellar FlbD family protein [Clostridiales bacterium]|nr:flagellar FlbD family protein [Clostridiales bacterium]